MVQVTGDHEEFERRYKEYNEENVIRFLAFDRDYPNSIISCLYYARENARSIREIISSEMWEQLNRYYLDLKEPGSLTLAVDDPHKFFTSSRCAVICFQACCIPPCPTAKPGILPGWV